MPTEAWQKIDDMRRGWRWGSLESLGLAFATTDRLANPAPNPLIQEAADGVIRLLGQRRRLSTHGAAGQPNAPGYVAQYLAAIALSNGLTASTFAADDHSLSRLKGV